MERPIGIFDSGVGGLTVLASLKDMLPHENMIYIGDNKHSPYGEKTKEQLFAYATQICDYFVKKNVKMIVLACNTTSANILEELQRQYPTIPIVGVIHSTIHDFLSQNLKSVLVIATKATIHSHKYKTFIHQYDPSINVYELETPRIVPLIESGQYKQGIQDVLQEYLKPYTHQVESLILGCTHYPIVSQQIQEVFGKEKTYVSSSDAICQEVVSYLKVHHYQNISVNKGDIQIYTTGDVCEFYSSSQDFFDYNQLKVQTLYL